MAEATERIAEKELSYDEALALKEEIRQNVNDPPIPRWHVVTRVSPSDARNFLNIPPAQGPGEATVTNRPDGKVDVYFWALLPGT
jgi:hypothetical protein